MNATQTPVDDSVRSFIEIRDQEAVAILQPKLRAIWKNYLKAPQSYQAILEELFAVFANHALFLFRRDASQLQSAPLRHVLEIRSQIIKSIGDEVSFILNEPSATNIRRYRLVLSMCGAATNFFTEPFRDEVPLPKRLRLLADPYGDYENEEKLKRNLTISLREAAGLWVYHLIQSLPSPGRLAPVHSRIIWALLDPAVLSAFTNEAWATLQPFSDELKKREEIAHERRVTPPIDTTHSFWRSMESDFRSDALTNEHKCLGVRWNSETNEYAYFGSGKGSVDRFQGHVRHAGVPIENWLDILRNEGGRLATTISHHGQTCSFFIKISEVFIQSANLCFEFASRCPLERTVIKVARGKTNNTNEKIEKALREIWEAAPKSQAEVFETLDKRKIPPPRKKDRPGSWMKWFEDAPNAARSFLSRRTAGAGLKPLPKGPK